EGGGERVAARGGLARNRAWGHPCRLHLRRLPATLRRVRIRLASGRRDRPARPQPDRRRPSSPPDHRPPTWFSRRDWQRLHPRRAMPPAHLSRVLSRTRATVIATSRSPRPPP